MLKQQLLSRDQQEAEDALAARGLTVLGQLQSGTLVVCRALDSVQTDVHRLSLSGCRLQYCCILEGEQELQQLDVSNNQLPSLLPLHTAALTALTALVASRNALSDVSGLGVLTGLRVLDLGRNKLTDLQHLTGLQHLQSLDFHHNAVTDLTPLQQLSNLVVVNAAANRIQQLPSLTNLTQLTEFNLRRNGISSIACAAADLARGAAAAATTAAVVDAFPSSLRRLSLSQNDLQSLQSLQPLRSLPRLEDICLDGNPFAAVLYQQQATAPGAAGGNAYRDAVMSCCPPTLLMLDMQPVSPAERVVILTNAIKLKAAQRTAAAAAAAGDQQVQPPDAVTAALGQSMQLQQRARHVPAQITNNVSGQQQRQQQQQGLMPLSQQQQGQDTYTGEEFMFSSPGATQVRSAAGSTVAAAAAAAGQTGHPAADDSSSTPRLGSAIPGAGSHASSSLSAPGAAAAAAEWSSITNKLRPQSGPPGTGQTLPAAAGLAAAPPVRQQGGAKDLGSAAAPAPAAAAMYATAGAGRIPRLDSAPLSSLAARAALAAECGDISQSAPGSSRAAAAAGIDLGSFRLRSKELLDQLQQLGLDPSSLDSPGTTEAAAEGSIPAADTSEKLAAEGLGGTAAAAAAAGDNNENETEAESDDAVVQSTQQQQQQQRYQGMLKLAAVACGVSVDDPDTSAARELAAAAGKPVANGAEDPEQLSSGVQPNMPDQDLQAVRAKLYDRSTLTATARPVTLPSSSGSSAPGVEVTGSRVVLTGDVLQSLRGEALAHVTHLTLQHVDYSKVLSNLQVLCGLRRLHTLSLRSTPGLSVLPQLHPLLNISRLKHLEISDCQICNLTLLQPYVAFRFSNLVSFNGAAVSHEVVCQSAELFGVLEATLAAALAQAPQQAALAASGVLTGKKGGKTNPPALNVAAAVAPTGSSNIWQLSASRPATSSGARELTQQQQQQPVDEQQVLGAEQADSAAAANAAADSSDTNSSIELVSQVLAAMTKGPLLPSAKHMQQGSQFAHQFVCEAVAVQQQLHEFHETAWPVLVERSINEGWTGHYDPLAASAAGASGR